jgi:hypothetical protein
LHKEKQPNNGGSFLFGKTVQEFSQAGTKIDLGEIETVYGLGKSFDLVFLGGCRVENNEIFPFQLA